MRRLSTQIPGKFLRGQSDILDNLSEKKRRNVSTRMKGNSRSATVSMTILLVRTALTDLDEPKSFRTFSTSRAFSTGSRAMHA